jgi:ketosteroid isomerase-like protein
MYGTVARQDFLENAMTDKRPEPAATELPPPIAALVEATNAHDTEAFLATFTEDAVLTDEGHNYRGAAAIKEWSDRQYIGTQVTLDVTGVDYRDGKIVVTANVDGNFPKDGLPDPFSMDLHFAVEKSKIVALSMRAAAN